MPSSKALIAGKSKRVVCTHCGQPMDVGTRAMSVFCTNCKKRLILENFKIKTYYAVREFSTCGDIVVEKKGHIVAPIRVSNLMVKGKIQGDVHARGRVEIKKTGSVKGDLEAPVLHIESGAVLEGFLRIGPIDKKNP